MKKVILILSFCLCLRVFGFAGELETNPDGPTGAIIFTCLGGIHTGGIDTKSGAERLFRNGLSGYLFSAKLETPISTSTTFILSVLYDKERQTATELQGGISYSRSEIMIVGGFKLFIIP